MSHFDKGDGPEKFQTATKPEESFALHRCVRRNWDGSLCLLPWLSHHRPMRCKDGQAQLHRGFI